MAANFPISLDNTETANPTAELHFPALFTRVLQICDALEVKVGINGSAVTTSHDYLIANRQPLDSDLTSIAGLSKTGNALKIIRVNAGETAYELAAAAGGDALVANPLSQFAATTSAQLRSVLSDESGTGAAYFQGGDLGTPSAGVLTSCTGTASGLTAGVATLASTVTVADTTDTTCFVALFESATGSLACKTDGVLTYNAATGALEANQFGCQAILATDYLSLENPSDAFHVRIESVSALAADRTLSIDINNNYTLTVRGSTTLSGGTHSGTNTGDQTSVSGSSGSCTGNAATATALATARNINGVAFDGTANITVTAAGSTLSDAVTIGKGGTGQTTAAAARVALLPSMTGNSLKTLRVNAGETDFELATAGVGDALTTNPLSQFAATTSAQLRGVLSDETGTGAAVFADTPTLITPVLGVATVTSVNKVAITAPATSATLTIADGKTLTASNTITFTATDGSTLAIGGGGTLGTAAYTASSAYQPIDATLTALAGLTIAADSLSIGTGADAFSQVTFAANKFPAKSSTGGLVAKDITDFALTILDDADAATARTTLGLVIGTNVQAFDAQLTSVAALSYTGNALKVVRVNAGETDFELVTPAGGGDALTSGTLAQFAATTSAQLAGVISDETGSGSLVFATSPALVTPALGTPSSGVLTNCTGQTWEKLSTATASASATIDFTGLTTDAAYCVVYTHVAPATDAVEFHCLTSTNNGSTYDSTIGSYRWAAIAGTDAAGSSFEGSSSDTKLRLGSNLGNASNETCSGSFTLYNPSAAKYGTTTWHNMVVNSSGVLVTRAGSGQRLSAADIDAIRFVMSSGNIASGIFTLYRLKE